jgi:glycosyltransferase involved in cell wall biosynthesis
VIVVDDGSTDHTLAVAKRYAARNVAIISQRNLGAGAARNAALAACQGDYIQWLDADDVLAPGKIAAQMAVAAEVADRRVVFSCPFGTFYYRTAKASFVETSLWRDLTPLDYFLTRFNENACFQTDAWLVSRELTQAAGPWTDCGSPDDDGEYFCRVVLHSTGITFVRDARSYYRVGNVRSLANRRSHEAMVALFASKAKCIRYLLGLEDSARTRTASVKLLQDWMFHLCDYHDVAAEAHRLAVDLGGTLGPRRLKRKYAPIEWVLGYDVALKASRALPTVRAQLESSIDRLFYKISKTRDSNQSIEPSGRVGSSGFGG